MEMLARERSRRFSAAAAGSVCARDTRVQHTKRQLGEEQEGGQGGWLGRRGAERERAAAAVEREKTEKEREEASKRRRLPREYRYETGDDGLSSRVYAAQWAEGADTKVFLIFSLARPVAARHGAAQRGATRDDYRPSGAARRDGRTEPSGMRECRQKSKERDGNGDRTRGTEIEREIGTDGDAVKSGREREKERGEKEERRLCRPGRRRASRRALISTGFRRTTDGQRWSLVAYEVGRTSLEVFRGRTRCAHHGRIESEREKVAAVERDGRSRTSRA